MRRSLVLLAIACLAVACGQAATGGNQPFEGTVAAVDGGIIDGADYTDADTALWFWAPWCPNCNAEAPDVADLARRYEGQVSLIGVAARDEVPAMADFVERHDLGHIPHIADVDEQIWERYSIRGQPAWVFIDGDTGETQTHVGVLGAEDLDERLAALAG